MMTFIFLLLTVGSVVSVAFGNHTDVEYTMADIEHFYGFTAFIVYLVILIVVLIVSYVAVRPSIHFPRPFVCIIAELLALFFFRPGQALGTDARQLDSFVHEVRRGERGEAPRGHADSQTGH
jgi:hypothetical protein